MLYDEVKKLSLKSKLPKDFKNKFAQKTGINFDQISKVEQDTIKSLQSSIENATVILIEDNQRIFDEIEKISISQFKEIKFPFDNFFIEFNMPNLETNSNDDIMTIGLHVYPDHVVGLKPNNTYNVFMYSRKGNKLNNLLPLMAMLKLDKLPRFYVACNTKCDNIVNPSNFGDIINREVCQRTERTADHCHIAQFLLYGIKIVIYAVNLINSKRETLLEDVTTIDNIKSNKNTKIVNNNTKNTQNKYIYIQTEKVKRKKNVRLIRKITRGRKSPEPHIRRGHYRHLRSGRVIWIEMLHVGLKEVTKNQKKIYKIK